MNYVSLCTKSTTAPNRAAFDLGASRLRLDIKHIHSFVPTVAPSYLMDLWQGVPRCYTPLMGYALDPKDAVRMVGGQEGMRRADGGDLGDLHTKRAPLIA